MSARLRPRSSACNPRSERSLVRQHAIISHCPRRSVRILFADAARQAAPVSEARPDLSRRTVCQCEDRDLEQFPCLHACRPFLARFRAPADGGPDTEIEPRRIMPIADLPDRAHPLVVPPDCGFGVEPQPGSQAGRRAAADISVPAVVGAKGGSPTSFATFWEILFASTRGSAAMASMRIAAHGARSDSEQVQRRVGKSPALVCDDSIPVLNALGSQRCQIRGSRRQAGRLANQKRP